MTNSPIYIFNVYTVRGHTVQSHRNISASVLHLLTFVSYEGGGANLILANLSILECPQNIVHRAFWETSVSFRINDPEYFKIF